MHTLVVAPAFRGFLGYERAMGPMQHVIEQPAPSLALDTQSIDDYAWRLRQAFDTALQTPG
jgi:hypothetical protein